MKVKVLCEFLPYKVGEILEVEDTPASNNHYFILESSNSEHKDGYHIPDNYFKPIETEKVALKFDNTKPDLSDIPLEAMYTMGAAFTYGQKKYSKNNFRNGHKVSRCLAAAIRHIYQHLDGQTNDTESGELHLGHAMASLAMAIYSFKMYPENDDRFKPDLEKWHKENITEMGRVTNANSKE